MWRVADKKWRRLEEDGGGERRLWERSATEVRGWGEMEGGRGVGREAAGRPLKVTPEESDSSSSPQAALFLPIYLFSFNVLWKKVSMFVLFFCLKWHFHIFLTLTKLPIFVLAWRLYVILVEIWAWKRNNWIFKASYSSPKPNGSNGLTFQAFHDDWERFVKSLTRPTAPFSNFRIKLESWILEIKLLYS